jgi:hypothetical protein
LEFQLEKGRRKVSLGADNKLTFEQDHPLPLEMPKGGKRDGVSYAVERLSPNRAVFSLERAE